MESFCVCLESTKRYLSGQEGGHLTSSGGSKRIEMQDFHARKGFITNPRANDMWRRAPVKRSPMRGAVTDPPRRHTSYLATQLAIAHTIFARQPTMLRVIVIVLEMNHAKAAVIARSRRPHGNGFV
jgi:hypothetical protein